MSRLIVKGLPSKCTEQQLRAHFKSFGTITDCSLKSTKEGKFRGFAFVGFSNDDEGKKALAGSNGTFIGRSKISVEQCHSFRDVPPKKTQATKGGKKSVEECNTTSQKDAKGAESDQILETGRLFIRNLPFSVTEDELKALFSKFGDVGEVQVVIDKSSGLGKGYAFVEFIFPEAALTAYGELDATIYKGRMLHIMGSAEKREKPIDQNEASSSFKREKESKMKTGASKASHSWNALFLGPDAVADSLAARLGTDKSTLLADGGDNTAAVRLALAETRLVEETREWLLKNGVKLDSFSRPDAARSKRVLLAKNLAAGTTADELQRLFAKHGDLQRILLPEHGLGAIVEFGNQVDAKQAFQALAYSRFRTKPLYLEWAPGDVFGEGATEEEQTESPTEPAAHETADEEDKAKKRRSKKHRLEEKQREEATKKAKLEAEAELEEQNESADVKQEANEDDEEASAIEPNSCIFVKNLNFSTTEEKLLQVFARKFGVKYARISLKHDPNRPDERLSMGFGHVQMKTADDAQEAMKTMQGCLLDGHALELRLSTRDAVDNLAGKHRATEHKSQNGRTKLLIRNIPFQASIHEVEQLFATFGELKNVRIPRKTAGTGHRGFGFVEYSSKMEAKRAHAALVHSTHLYGRRLVVEWADEQAESVDALREKTAKTFGHGKRTERSTKRAAKAVEKSMASARDNDDDEDDE